MPSEPARIPIAINKTSAGIPSFPAILLESTAVKSKMDVIRSVVEILTSFKTKISLYY